MTSDAGARERVVSWVVNRAISFANKRGNVAQMQERHNAKRGRVFYMEIVDTRQRFYFRVWEGKLERVVEPAGADGGFSMSSDAIVALVRGKRRWMDPATGNTFERAYSPLEALTHGDIRIDGEAATNDALLFARYVSKEVYPNLVDEMRSASPAANEAASS